ncbi:PrsW family intramembrane metalloprotease [Brasilonema octagenarum]|uniref:PrsW family intramembrane metalloprotease n=1 Tax=Brasilonema octagenarum UFV-OR1 TaxID=417115 RepID=A0ABX1M8I7_9CYAN|nr:PrsW family intramembrane metalloprotease [Brasilonema octagenarum]NMF64880.1 PrsW family intramembrane metalloprotease [Brasilonema octagenarum UFV-OR1]
MLRSYMELLCAVIPPLLLLLYYYYRIPSAPSLMRLLFFFVLGAISGVLALALEGVFETVANNVVDWERMQRVFPGVVVRQLIEVGPVEETCKLVAVIVPTYLFQPRYRFRPTSVFLFTIAVALGFTAQENWIYLSHDTAPIFERIISTPIHAMFSAPWGYVLAICISENISLYGYRQFLPAAWLNAVICHGLVNVLSMSDRYPIPLNLLNYGLFPFLLWMFWRLQQLLRRVQGELPIMLISGYTPKQRFQQRIKVLLALLLAGNALFGLFLLVKSLSLLNISQLFDRDVVSFILSRLLLNAGFGLVAWVIYTSLRRSARE